jgi:hypothetical protein
MGTDPRPASEGHHGSYPTAFYHRSSAEGAGAMRIRAILALVMAAVVGSGCGGGSGGDSSESGTGSLTMLIGDGPIDDLDQVWITVGAVELNMAGGKKEVVLDTPQSIELLSLRNLTEVLLTEEIVSGRVNKVRLLLDSLEIVRKGSADRESIDVPAGGWIELNPQGGIQVRAGQTITVFIDVDLEQSLHVVQSGNTTYEFRPQVFVDIASEGDPSRIVRLKGIARGVNPTVDDFDLCDLRRESGDGTNNNLLDCVHINDTDAWTYVNGSELEEGATVTAFGYMDFSAVEDTMNALVLIVGEEGPIESDAGSVAALPDANTIHVDTPPEGEPFVTAHLLPGAIVVERHGDPAGALEVGDLVETFGFRNADTSLDTFLAIHENPSAP